MILDGSVCSGRCPQKQKRLGLCGQRPEMWKLFKDDSVVGVQGLLTLKMK